jgi:hypothetical protein
MQLPKESDTKKKRILSEGVGTFTLIALLGGLLIVIGSVALEFYKQPVRVIVAEILREFGIGLISVFGISFLYEKLSAEHAFRRFFTDLQKLIRQGESNAAMCEALGILELHANRKSYEARHNFAEDLSSLGEGDRVRITGRSLIFTMYSWQHFQTMLRSGATLELCLYDPSIKESPLQVLAGYSQEETALAIHRFVSSMHPWLKSQPHKGSLEIRFHDVHLLDSFVEVQRGNEAQGAWDLNFGEGMEARQVFVVDLNRPLGHNLASERYGRIWAQAQRVFRFEHGTIVEDKLSGPATLAS